MKTILTRMKTLVQDNQSGTLSYVPYVEISHPELTLINISTSMLPSIFLVPVSTVEEWEASQRKIAKHIVKAFLIMEYNKRELNIIGDETRGRNGKGITDLVIDFLTVFRGHRLAVSGNNYLDKPLDVDNIDYFKDNWSEDAFLIVAEITMNCTRLFIQQTLPGDV